MLFNIRKFNVFVQTLQNYDSRCAAVLELKEPVTMMSPICLPCSISQSSEEADSKLFVTSWTHTALTAYPVQVKFIQKCNVEYMQIFLIIMLKCININQYFIQKIDVSICREVFEDSSLADNVICIQRPRVALSKCDEKSRVNTIQWK